VVRRAERVDLPSQSIAREKELDAAVANLRDVPAGVGVKVSRVQRVNLVPEVQLGFDSATVMFGEGVSAAQGASATKLTAVLVTVSVPNAKDRILVFPAE
jgi:hypothetical protein